MELNKIYCIDALEGLKQLEDNSIDLIVTSPPYDTLRTYNGCPFNFIKDYPTEMYRVLKNGGIVVWVVGDKVEDGSESLSSFKQALMFKEIGFKVHDTMIYQKDSFPCPEANRYLQCFEYMFIFSKGTPKTFNPIQIFTQSYKPSTSSTKRYPNGETKLLKYEQGKRYRNRENIWKYGVGYLKSSKNAIAFEHPAIFPEKLAEDHILSWINEGNIILDPFMGSGATAVACKKLNRNYIGFEISAEYCIIADKRLLQTNVMATKKDYGGYFK